MRQLRLWSWVVVSAALLHLGWVIVTRTQAPVRQPRPSAKEDSYYRGFLANDGSAVRILQFYANAPEVIEGEAAVICYGVQNAEAVRLEPPVEELKPAVNRCISILPVANTTYRLVASGAGGSEVSASFTLNVKPAPPSILFVEISGRKVKRGEPFTFCYGVKHATSARLDPLGMRLAPEEKSCRRFFPVRTLEYTLVAEGQGRPDREKFTVAVH
jgi:hypothetical protein